MAYEHAKEVNEAAAHLLNVIEMILDQTDDRAQMWKIGSEALAAYGVIKAATDGESKPAYKAKVFEKLSLVLANRSLDVLQPDSAS